MATFMEHPIASELLSLKEALDKYQHAAHTSSLQLQRAHFEASEAATRSKAFEADNIRLQHEIELLRANPEPTPVSIEVSELTIALRRVSDKLSLTEDILLRRTTELTHNLSEKSLLQLEINGARKALDIARQREEAYRLREDQLEQKCKAAEEEARMADMVIMEYADLVRTLEGRKYKNSNEDSDGALASPSPSTLETLNVDSYYRSKSDGLVQSLTENRFSLQRLLHEFNSESSHLQAEITRLNAEISSVQADLGCERENSQVDRLKLAEALLAIDRYKTDDMAAAKLVSRYMRFSQSSINALQSALSTAKSRHAATLVTMSHSSNELAQSLEEERRRGSKLRDVLDELTEDISRETFGRRREISLRLHCIVREEKIFNALGAWIRRAEERRSRLQTPVSSTNVAEELRVTLDHMIQDALDLVVSLSSEDQPISEANGNLALGRVILAQDMVRSLTVDLEKETEKRMALVMFMSNELFMSPPNPPLDVHAVQGNSFANKSNEVDPSLSKSLLDSLPALDNNSAPGTVSPHAQSPSIVEKTGFIAGGTQLPASKPDTTQVTRISSERREVVKVLDTWGVKEPSMVSDILPLREFTRVSHRYDDLQHAFRNCHLTLAELQADTASMSLASESGIPILQTILHRLDDFCEDTRVELEIRIADEERMAKGFQALLGVPGALAGETEKRRVELELRAFLDGTTPSVVKTFKSCTSKLEDLQHDISQVKRALHESIDATSDPQSSPLPRTPPAWPSWTPPFLSRSPSRVVSPAPSFGAVITAPRPRPIPLNSVSPLSKMASNSNLAIDDPYTSLGLRIPMPARGPLTFKTQLPSTRLRTTSTSSSVYVLGLGSLSGYFSKPDAIGPSKGIEHNPEMHQNDSDVE